ncbi:MAG: hypothetical protein ACI9U2_001205 [Bradymonadia bacterium]|jgi:hypothetical protein
MRLLTLTGVLATMAAVLPAHIATYADAHLWWTHAS